MSVSLSLVLGGTLILFAVQGILIVVDEIVFHRRRGLNAFESFGHPIDTALFAVPIGLAALWPPSTAPMQAYVGAAIFSALAVTKDEWIHARACTPEEHWLHALLFLLHLPILIGVGLAWWLGAPRFVFLLMASALGVFAFWQLSRKSRPHDKKIRPTVNNTFYDELGEKWFSDDTHAIALLRREAQIKASYVSDVCRRRDFHAVRVLDLGAGAGLVALPLADQGFVMTAADISPAALAVAKEHTPSTAPIRYVCADALNPNLNLGKFEVVLLLDVLEHVENPKALLATAATHLAPGGVLIFHTFNRTWAAWLLAVKALQWFTRNCPPHVHILRLFIKPRELKVMLESIGLKAREWRGIRPRFDGALVTSAFNRQWSQKVGFKYTRSLKVGYIGFATEGKGAV